MTFFRNRDLLLSLGQKSPYLKVSCCWTREDVRSISGNWAYSWMKVYSTKLGRSCQRRNFLAEICWVGVLGVPNVPFSTGAYCYVEISLGGKLSLGHRVGVPVLCSHFFKEHFFRECIIELFLGLQTIGLLLFLLTNHPLGCSLNWKNSNLGSNFLDLTPALLSCHFSQGLTDFCRVVGEGFGWLVHW